MNQAFTYFVAYCAEKWNVAVYALGVMSNHYHPVIKDRDGVHPHFFRDLNRMTAQYIKATYKTRGQVFRPKANRVVCLHPEAIVDKIAYTLANPVSAGAVRYLEEWPGLRSRIDDMGRTTWTAKRPEAFFGKRKTLPDTASLTLGFPEELEEHYGSRETAKHALKERLDHHVKNAQAEVRQKGWKYLGAERAAKQDPFKQSRSWEVFDTLVPAFATRGLSHEERIKAKQTYRAWHDAYDECRRRFQESRKDTHFCGMLATPTLRPPDDGRRGHGALTHTKVSRASHTRRTRAPLLRISANVNT
ncbi:MAG: hypothetical protein AAF938_23045 [Myxococcota bacterium]